ncbi:hypothetical protein E2I00_001453, partial [Balaenoptera physalus]
IANIGAKGRREGSSWVTTLPRVDIRSMETKELWETNGYKVMIWGIMMGELSIPDIMYLNTIMLYQFIILKALVMSLCQNPDITSYFSITHEEGRITFFMILMFKVLAEELGDDKGQYTAKTNKRKINLKENKQHLNLSSEDTAKKLSLVIGKGLFSAIYYSKRDLGKERKTTGQGVKPLTLRLASLAVEELSVRQLGMILGGRLKFNVGEVFTVCMCIAACSEYVYSRKFHILEYVENSDKEVDKKVRYFTLKPTLQNVEARGLNADTEWKDILRKRGILPSKGSLKDLEKEAEERVLQQSIVKTYEDMTLEELEDNEEEFSEEDERAIEMYRQQRLAEWKATQLENKFGDVLEISGKDYVQEVNKAGIPLRPLINQHFSGLARKFPDVKFIKAISTTCIPSYPDRNLPTTFVYLEGDIKAEFIGPLVFGGMNLTMDELERKLSESGAIKVSLEENPKKPIEDVLLSSVQYSIPTRRDIDNLCLDLATNPDYTVLSWRNKGDLDGTGFPKTFFIYLVRTTSHVVRGYTRAVSSDCSVPHDPNSGTRDSEKVSDKPFIWDLDTHHAELRDRFKLDTKMNYKEKTFAIQAPSAPVLEAILTKLGRVREISSLISSLTCQLHQRSRLIIVHSHVKQVKMSSRAYTSEKRRKATVPSVSILHWKAISLNTFLCISNLNGDAFDFQFEKQLVHKIQINIYVRNTMMNLSETSSTGNACLKTVLVFRKYAISLGGAKEKQQDSIQKDDMV